MTTNLWSANTPSRFWMCEAHIPEDCWHRALVAAIPALQLTDAPDDVDALLALTLGEGQFGADHWRLGLATRMYYELKPFIARIISRLLRRLQIKSGARPSLLGWPVEPRLVDFLWQVLREILRMSQGQKMLFRYFWPNSARLALVLTHDVETAAGQRFIPQVAEMEERLGFRSSFNLVPERYPIDQALVSDLRARGFEIGIHGLRHDGKLFASQQRFMQRVQRINEHARAMQAVGFRAPLTHRQPEWMQELEAEYDSSFFDTDPYEPIPGGTMSIYPFYMGHLVQLPYTLAQDYTVTSVLGHRTPALWLNKVDYIARYHGMALVNTHPDYLREANNLRVYDEFLHAMRERDDHWQALPCEVARWWRHRSTCDAVTALADGMLALAELVEGEVAIRLPETVSSPSPAIPHSSADHSPVRAQAVSAAKPSHQ